MTTDTMDPVPSPDLVLGFAYDELRRLARAVRTKRPRSTLCTTELIHEAWLKLQDVSRFKVQEPEHLKRKIADDVLAVAVIALDRALATLAGMDNRRASVVECRFFAGMNVEETARVLGVGPATVKRDWRVARAWLAQALSEGYDP